MPHEESNGVLKTGSAQDISNDLAMHIRQAEVAALGTVGELGVVEA